MDAHRTASPLDLRLRLLEKDERIYDLEHQVLVLRRQLDAERESLRLAMDEGRRAW